MILSLALLIPLSSNNSTTPVRYRMGFQTYHSQSRALSFPPSLPPPVFPSSVNGLTVHPVAPAQNLGITLESSFSSFLYLIHQQVQLLYPQNISKSTHFLRPPPLPPWSKLPSSLFQSYQEYGRSLPSGLPSPPSSATAYC